METPKVLKLKDKQTTPTVGQFISCLLTSASIAHKMHLRVTGTGSYAAHKALNSLYDSLPEHADNLAEKYQGYTGNLIQDYVSMDETPYLKMKPIEFVAWLLEYVEKSRTTFGDNSMMQNLVDELIADIASTHYKLKFLS